ncbi:hypothetical protein [Acinetobacter cumulans]|uniref:hypothetical protein n=1 Tax=Acinetobacter cumulans TaxID=2136182 RepID=UPI001443F4FF|nr:hypothetical protein [Acinetobacter cumulans]
MAAASLGRLTLDLAVKLGSFEQGMTQAERKTKQTTDNMGKAFSGFKDQVADALGGTQLGSIIDGFNSKLGSIKGGVGVASAALAGMAVGGVVVAFAGLSKLAIETAKADAQLQVLANRANTSVQSFQILERAALGLGVSQDQLGSILADTQEKLGEFSATQGGGAADFFDALKNNTKMSEDQIKSFAKTLQGKDGIEAIQLLNDKMDELGVTSQERRFVFESLASDLGNLAPLFAENGKLLDEYGSALEDTGVLKTKESMEQSRLLAAQTESLQIRYEGFKNQLASQMMPILNGLISQFMDGSKKSGQFGSIIQSVGVIAKGVGFLIIGLAASIKSIVIAVSAFAEQAANISITAQNVWNADGVVDKAKALGAGVKEGVSIAKNAMNGLSENFSSTLKSMSVVMDANATKATDPLAKVLLKTSAAANQSAKGLKIDTKAADENAKAKEKAAKEQENLNKMVGASALSGLRIKSSEAFAGGQVRGYTANFAQLAQKQLGADLNRFTAFNDLYHKGTNSKHATGNAFDFTIADASKSAQAVAQLESVAKRYGYVVKILDEYKQKSARATGGHLHVSVLGFKGTAEAAKQAQDELSLVAQTNEEAARIQAETQKAQQSIVFQYLSEREKMEVEHGAKILEIQKAFAGDDSAIKEYTDKQNAAYQKDVAEYQEAQKQKELSDKRQLLEAKRHWISAADYAKEYYVLVREEILNTAEYSPEMKQSLVKEANFNQGLESNAEREQVWGDYQNRFGAQKSPYQNDVDLLQEALRQKLIDEKEYQQQRLRLQLIYGAQYTSDFAGMMMGLVDSSSSAYAILGGIQKGAALYATILNGYTTISAAWASAPFPYNLPAVATATMETGLLQAAVSALSPVGMAHNGIDNIPKEGTWLLDGGERVLNPQQNKDLTNYLANKPERSQSIENNLRVIIVKDEDDAKDHLYGPDGEKAFMYHYRRNKSKM